MNFKSVTINLLLTTLSGGVLLQTLEAQAATITFDPFNPATVTRSVTSSSFASGNTNASTRSLDAFADTTATGNPLSWLNTNARATISLSSFFTVTPGKGEKNGDKIDAILEGRLVGYLLGGGVDFFQQSGRFTSGVDAEVSAGGFDSYHSNIPQHTDSVFVPSRPRINVVDNFSRSGRLTIGERYPFNMKLTVSAQKNGTYQATSNFGGEGRGLTAIVKPVPEPLTMLASATALGFGAFFKRQHSKNPKKS
jgi:hypothetical protein